jgi:POT family proton-dependent oligopeptide transporter
MRVLALILLIPAMAVALLTNQEIFNAYLVWADRHFQLTFFGNTLPTSWMITIDATLSFSMLVAVAAFFKWYGTFRREPDELGKMIIGSFFTIAGGLCLYVAALTQGGGKIGQLYSTMATPTFWLLHVASAAVGLAAFALFKLFMSRRMAEHHEAAAAA